MCKSLQELNNKLKGNKFKYCMALNIYIFIYIFNRPGVAGAVLHTPS